ncbi:hypothetical protein JAAARDRAFT_209446 [Jaapia argillacea MUCL 33604]|uniref:Uncharacterized protein n=1 Tax=Jaapia argillacea MUCL 33604 TaxID=933084 RepID=A0A067PHE8_9AGAM|nr:hypothetical protein JAAARDRAFT_209446 [Jaapia argillacea MUCL 33604]
MISRCLAGALFALANWAFLDACLLSSHAHGPPGEPDDEAPVHVSFVDWVPGIGSLLFLFIGFALMAGGLAGSVTVLVLRYTFNHDYPEAFT